MENLEKLLEKIKRKEVAVGAHVSGNDSQFTEILGNSGVDYLWIDTEHTAIDRYNVLLHLIAARAAGVPAIVRIPWNDMVLAKPILEMGPQGIIFPFISTAEEAKYAIDSCMYPPDGSRGYGPKRAVKHGYISSDEYINVYTKKLLKIIQIETKSAVDNIKEIASVPGVNMLVIGPNDLSGSYGKLLKVTDPEMIKVYKHVIDVVHACGKPIMVSTGDCSEKSIEMWLKLGIDLVTFGSDASFVANGAKSMLAAVNKGIANIK